MLKKESCDFKTAAYNIINKNFLPDSFAYADFYAIRF